MYLGEKESQRWGKKSKGPATYSLYLVSKPPLPKARGRAFRPAGGRQELAAQGKPLRSKNKGLRCRKEMAGGEERSCPVAATPSPAGGGPGAEPARPLPDGGGQPRAVAEGTPPPPPPAPRYPGEVGSDAERS